ncbi:molybdate ABC transporter permease subunit [Natronospora cellulosivora (SeqCode)]
MHEQVLNKELTGAFDNSYNKRLSFSFKPNFFKLLVFILSIINIGFILLIVFSLFYNSSVSNILAVLSNITVWQAVRISFSSIVISALITILIGTAVAYIISQKDNKTNRIISILLNVPLLMPPAVAGLALLMTFGRRGFLANLLSNFTISFSFFALIIVQVFVMLPLFTQSLKNSFQVIANQDIQEAAMIAGAGDKDLLLYIYLPLSRRPFFTGLTMACLRAAGEFGATLLFAGNLEGRTQTLSTAIYTFIQQDINLAVSLAVLMLVLFLIPLFIIELSRAEKN